MLRPDQLPLAGFAHDWVAAFAALPGWRTPAPKPPDPLADPVPVSNDWPGAQMFWASL